ncbi:MAG: NUDIX domain-containing protein [Candidatus Aenigmatarchaeota archaeon]
MVRKLSGKSIRKIIKEISEHIRPTSMYIYGSYIRLDSKEDSDIDIIIVLDRDFVNFNWLRNFTEKYGFLGLTILTEDEIKNGAHASFNSFYFINLLFSSIHIYGKDILLKEFSKFPDFNSALWRVQCILQRIKNVLSNNNKLHEELYWFKKLNHWLYLVISEFLFFTKGYYNPNLDQIKEKFEKEFFKLNINNLEDLYNVLSKIKQMYLNYPSRIVRIRPGAFVLIKNRANEYLMLERSDGRGFEFIKGGVEVGESFRDAALREVKEEIGIKLSSNDLIELPVTLSFQFPLREGYEIRIYKGFLVIIDNIDTNSLTLDKFFSSVKFMKISELLNVMSFPEYYRAVKEADELLRKKLNLILYLNKIRSEFE